MNWTFVIMRGMYLLLAGLTMACAVCGAATAYAEQPTDNPDLDHRRLTVNGATRLYEISMPRHIEGKTAAVVLLHGARSSASAFRHYTQFDRIAAAADIVAVYPEGLNDRWRVLGVTDVPPVDDMAFIDTLMDALVADPHIDAERIYIGGLATGGELAWRYACIHAERIAGLALVSANAPVGVDCKPSRPVPIVAMHGTTDTFMPMDGGEASLRGGGSAGPVVSFADTIAPWLEAGGCTSPKTRLLVPSHPPHDTLRVHRTVYACSEAPVISFVVEGGGHTWPGADQNFFTRRVLGPATRQIDAGAVLWNFFHGAEQDPE